MMSVDIVLHNRTRTRIYGESFFRRVGDAAAPYLGIPKTYRVEVGISLIGSKRMRVLNVRYRGQNNSTDVLSFPLHTKPIKGYTSILLGDLFISPSDVVAKAAHAGHSAKEQMTWTVVHGLLHLAGYDHERGRAAAHKMFATEQKIIKKLKTRS